LEQFKKLYNLWFRSFNILPVYFTKEWTKHNLEKLSYVMKYILDLGLKNKGLNLYWFQENFWVRASLVNDSIFIDIDWKVYYTDIVSTYNWKTLKDKLLLWNINDIRLCKVINYNFKKEDKVIGKLEESLYNKVSWQRELHKIMDYFSVYLNKNAK